MPKNRWCRYSLLFLLLVLSFFLNVHSWGTSATAANLVSGEYLPVDGSFLTLRLTVADPPPANLIVEQFLPPGNIIAGTSPHAIKINVAKGTAKWFFRHVPSGTISLVIRLSSPLNGKAKAVVHYRDPAQENFTEIQITQ